MRLCYPFCYRIFYEILFSTTTSIKNKVCAEDIRKCNTKYFYFHMLHSLKYQYLKYFLFNKKLTKQDIGNEVYINKYNFKKYIKL